MKTYKMAKNKNLPTNRYGDEAPSTKLFLIVIVIAIVLMVLAKVAYVLFHI
jgi:flagellar basal body-associated protein FliL